MELWDKIPMESLSSRVACMATWILQKSVDQSCMYNLTVLVGDCFQNLRTHIRLLSYSYRALSKFPTRLANVHSWSATLDNYKQCLPVWWHLHVVCWQRTNPRSDLWQVMSAATLGPLSWCLKHHQFHFCICRVQLDGNTKLTSPSTSPRQMPRKGLEGGMVCRRTGRMRFVYMCVDHT